MLFNFLKVYHFGKKIRLGKKRDGGYVIGVLSGEYDCYISAGVGDDESFSRDFIRKYRLPKSNCFAFDRTIDRYPTRFTRQINFIRKNIGTSDDHESTNLSFLTDKYQNIFLKIDIEGGEYPWLLSLEFETLLKFKQIVIEFHGINNDDWNCLYQDKLKCLEKLTKTHYLIHAHGNNYASKTNSIPNVIELTYVNQAYFPDPPKLNAKRLPIPKLDYPNNTKRTDYQLNFPPFRHSVTKSDS